MHESKFIVTYIKLKLDMGVNQLLLPVLTSESLYHHMQITAFFVVFFFYFADTSNLLSSEI